MRNALLAVHVSLACIWLGCILTEALFERALLPEGKQSRLLLARLHVRVDKVVELPAIVGVLLTGIALWSQGVNAGAGFLIMVSTGIVGIVANLYCVWLVFRRVTAAEGGNWSEFERIDHRQHKFGAVVLVAVLVALVAGMSARNVA